MDQAHHSEGGAMTALTVGFLAGFAISQALNYWGAMWRACCREHYLTHQSCTCGDCRRDREVKP